MIEHLFIKFLFLDRCSFINILSEIIHPPPYVKPHNYPGNKFYFIKSHLIPSLFFPYSAHKKIPDNKIAPNTKISSIEKGIQHTIYDNTAEIVGYKETAYHSAMLVLYLVDRMNAVKSKSIRYLECFIYITLLFAHKLFYQFCGFWR